MSRKSLTVILLLVLAYAVPGAGESLKDKMRYVKSPSTMLSDQIRSQIDYQVHYDRYDEDGSGYEDDELGKKIQKTGIAGLLGGTAWMLGCAMSGVETDDVAFQAGYVVASIGGLVAIVGAFMR